MKQQSFRKARPWSRVIRGYAKLNALEASALGRLHTVTMAAPTPTPQHTYRQMLYIEVVYLKGRREGEPHCFVNEVDMAAARKKKPLSPLKESTVMIRTAPQDKSLIEKAADQLGLTVSSFMLQNAIRAARKELAEVERLSLTERDVHSFFSALMNPPAPNSALKKAFREYGKQTRK